MSMTCPRFCAALLTMIALILGQAAEAFPRHGSVGLTEMVICADGAERTIRVDASGTPVENTADCAKCPDCLSPALAVLPSHDVAPLPQGVRPVARLMGAPFPKIQARRPVPAARAPPMMG